MEKPSFVHAPSPKLIEPRPIEALSQDLLEPESQLQPLRARRAEGAGPGSTAELVVKSTHFLLGHVEVYEGRSTASTLFVDA